MTDVLNARRAFESGVVGLETRSGRGSKLRCNSIHQSGLITLTVIVALVAMLALQATAQQSTPPPAAVPSTPPPPPGPALTPKQLDHLVSRIALYPDPLPASYWEQIPEAAAWANQHSYLTGKALADVIREDNLQWNPSVLALLPFPSILNMMAQDPTWTQQLGNAVLTQRAEVMDAVQRLRRSQLFYVSVLVSGAGF